MGISGSSLRPPGREHIPFYPRGFIAIRYAQLVCAIIIVGLTASGLPPFEHHASLVPSIFLCMSVALLTMLTSIYHIVWRYALPAIYNYWVVLGLEILHVVFWIIAPTFIILDFNIYRDAQLRWVSPLGQKFYNDRMDEVARSVAREQLAAGSLGALEFLMFLISLIIHSICLHHHCREGLHSLNLPQYNAPVPGNDKAHMEKPLPSNPAPASTSVAADPYQPGPSTAENTSGHESKLNSATATQPVTPTPATAAVTVPTNPATLQPAPGTTFVYVVPQQPQGQQQILYATPPTASLNNSIAGGGYVLTVPTTSQESHQPQQVVYYPSTSSPSPPPAQSPQQTVVISLPDGQVELPSQRMDDPPEPQELPLQTQGTAWAGQYRR